MYRSVQMDRWTDGHSSEGKCWEKRNGGMVKPNERHADQDEGLLGKEIVPGKWKEEEGRSLGGDVGRKAQPTWIRTLPS